MFQSRNRGSCRFKAVSGGRIVACHDSFNLVIEVLVVSRGIQPCEANTYHGFNLVIEVLVVSRQRLVIHDSM